MDSQTQLWHRLPFWLTITGSLPIWIGLFLPRYLFYVPQIQGSLLIYIAMIIAFLGGMSWTVATLNNKPILFMTSTLMVIIPWLLLLAVMIYYPYLIAFWASMIALLLIQLIIDYRIKNLMSDWFWTMRAIGSTIVIIAIVAVMVRLSI